MYNTDANALYALANELKEYAALMDELGMDTRSAVGGMTAALCGAVDAVKRDVAARFAVYESVADIQSRRAVQWDVSLPVDESTLHSKMRGAILGRFVGCTLGAPVEMMGVSDMEALAAYNKQAFPPDDYFINVPNPSAVRYGMHPCYRYTKPGIRGVPVDDDITYAILTLLLLEKYGAQLTTQNVADTWQAILPYACTAEDVALKNIGKGVRVDQLGVADNPYMQWIGAAIRADGFGYAYAGKPSRAAAISYADAYLTHRFDGLYGELFCAAAIAAAFSVNDPIDAVIHGMNEIPCDSTLYRDLQWALDSRDKATDYRAARQLVDGHFAGMSPVHTNNNMALIVFGLHIGGGDFTKTIGNIVAMGLDNDCTAATAGSIIGAMVGDGGIPPHFTESFDDTVYTYITGHEKLSIEDVVDRYIAIRGRFAAHG